MKELILAAWITIKTRVKEICDSAKAWISSAPKTAEKEHKETKKDTWNILSENGYEVRIMFNGNTVLVDAMTYHSEGLLKAIEVSGKRCLESEKERMREFYRVVRTYKDEGGRKGKGKPIWTMDYTRDNRFFEVKFEGKKLYLPAGLVNDKGMRAAIEAMAKTSKSAQFTALLRRLWKVC